MSGTESPTLKTYLGHYNVLWGSCFPQPVIYGEPVSAYSDINSSTSPKGRLVFYALTTFDSTIVFDGDNRLTTKWFYSSKAIPIIAIEEGARYHIHYSGQSQRFTIHTAGIQPGLYLVEVIDNTHTLRHVSKIIIN